MLNPKIIPIILCGGQGSRLWPLSRKSYPKQFLQLTQGGSLLQETAKRVLLLPNVTAPIVICNEAHYFLTHEQLQDIGINPASLILEPVGKSTAPAIAMAAFQAINHFAEDALLLIMPADHFIQDITKFQQAVQIASQQVGQSLLTFGIKPTMPKTGYGYIKSGSPVSEFVNKVTQFTEKPNLSTAEHYCASGEYFWNSGMFLFRAKVFLQELQQHAPDIKQICHLAFNHAIRHDNYVRITLESFRDCPEDSIDYAIMEKTSHATIMPIDCGWADMGDWTTIAEIHNVNEHGNVIKGEVITEDVTNSCLYSNNRLIAAIGIHDQVIIETRDAVLIANKNRTQDVKRIVSQLQQLSHQAAENHYRVIRPWGYYETLIESDNYIVKHIMVKPNAGLSLQVHQHRAEHWVVVNGNAKVECEQRQYELENNESTYIPPGSRHRLSNAGSTPLHIIEIQTGEYLSEEDIFRFDENYHAQSETIAS